MIYQNTEIENIQNKFSDAIRELQIGKLLRSSNITKNCGIPAFEVFQFLLLLVFQGKNLFRFLNSKHKDQAVSKIPITVSLMKLPITGRNFFCFWRQKLFLSSISLPDLNASRCLFWMIRSSNATAAKQLNFLPGSMTMWSISFRKDLPFWPLAGRMVTVLFQLLLTCFLLQNRKTAIRKSLAR